MSKRSALLSLCLALAVACSPGNDGAPETLIKPAPAIDRLIDRALLFGNPERAQGRISPDGRWISFIAPLDDVLNVWIAPVDDIALARPVTGDTGRGIRMHTWAPDGEQLLYLQDTGGDENFLLHAVDPESGVTRNLTPFENTTAQIVAISPDRPDAILVGLNDRDERFHDVHLLDLESGELELVERNEGFIDFVADDDLEVRLARAPRPGGGFDLLRRDGEDWTPLLTAELADEMTTRPVAISPGGDHVYMVDSRERDTGALARIHLTSGEREVLGADPRADVSEVFIDVASRRVAAYAVDFEQPEWTVLDSELAADFERLQATIDGEVRVVNQSFDGRLWMIWSGTATNPGAYHLYDRENGTIRHLFDTRPAIADAPLTAMQPHVIEARDGLELVSYLSLPRWVSTDEAGRPGEPLPMVLLVHGGPWARDHYGYHPEHQWLANRGYAVLSVNFRGSTGFGKAFVNAGDREWAAAMHDDLLDAVDWAVNRGVARRDAVAIMGGSYGGYATLVGLTLTPEVFACGVDIVGPSNLETLLASVPPYWAALFENLASRVGDPRTEEGRALLRERSPLHRADAIERPLLIAQGANDPRVKQAESDQIVEAMLANEQPVTYVRYPDEGHGFARPENRLAFYAVTDAFLAQCLNGRHQDFGDALEGSSTDVPTGAEFVPGLEAALKRFEPVVAH